MSLTNKETLRVTILLALGFKMKLAERDGDMFALTVQENLQTRVLLGGGIWGELLLNEKQDG